MTFLLLGYWWCSPAFALEPIPLRGGQERLRGAGVPADATLPAAGVNLAPLERSEEERFLDEGLDPGRVGWTPDPLWRVPPEPGAAGAARDSVLDPATATPTVPAVAVTPAYSPGNETALHQAVGTADTLAGGLGGVPGTISSPFLQRAKSQSKGYQFGPITMHGALSFGVSAIVEKESGTGGGSGNVGSLGGVGVPGDLSRGQQGGDLSGVYGTASLSLSAFLGEAELGRTLSLDETTVFSYPSSTRGDGNAVDETLTLQGAYLFTKLRTGFSLDLSQISGLSRDVGTDADRNLTTLALTAGYDWSEKSTVGLNLTFPVRQFSGGISSAGVTATGTYDYRNSPKTSIGLGLTGGWTTVESQANQLFEQVTLRLGYTATEKVSFNGSFGIEHRTVGTMSSWTPIFGMGATWAQTAKRSFTISANRGTFNSASVQNTNFVTTSLQVAVRQEIGTRLSGSFSLGYENAAYSSVGTDGEGGRKDNFITGQIGLSCQVLERVLLTLEVAGGQNWSNESSLRFAQCSLQAGITF